MRVVTVRKVDAFLLLAARVLRAIGEELAVRPAARLIAREAARRPDPHDAVVFAKRFDLRGFDVTIAPAQVRSELTGLACTLQREAPRVIVEIGSARGGSLFVFATTAADDAVIISIDLPHGPFGVGQSHRSRRERLYKAFAARKQTIHRIRSSSHEPSTLAEVKRLLGSRQVDFLFIDGDHSYEGVRGDYELYAGLVRPGGLIGFHDIVPGSPKKVGGVPRFWQELKHVESTEEIVEDWGQGGYGIGLVRVPDAGRSRNSRAATGTSDDTVQANGDTDRFPLFTVAITVWEREEMLPHAIQTVLSQTDSRWELLVYSDGPSDVARETVAALQPYVPIRYRAVERRPKHWGNHLRRLALEEGSGSHVCFLGHDCLLYPHYLETHAANLEGNAGGLSVVPIDYWRKTRLDAKQPRNDDLMHLQAGEIDLLCVAYPRRLALETGCFSHDTQHRRDADFLAYDRLRQISRPLYRPGPTQAAHF
jgi:cephalosporin hydroxylase